SSTASRRADAAESSRSSTLEVRKDAPQGFADFKAQSPPADENKLASVNVAPAQEKVQAKPQEKTQDGLKDKEISHRETDERLGAGRQTDTRAARQTENKQDTQARFLKQEAAPRPAAAAAPRSQEPAPGGEGNYAFDGISENAAQGKLRIEPADNGGTPPALANASEIEVPTELRGREFYVVVEAWGRVREVRPSDDRQRKKKAVREEAQAQAQSGSVSEEERSQKAADSLRNMRFAPSDRP